MSTSIEQAPTTSTGGPDDKSFEVTPKNCCPRYFLTIIVVFSITVAIRGLACLDDKDNKSYCYIELFAQSVSVSNFTNAANVSTADWGTVTSRLLRGDEVISKVPPSFDDFGRLYASDKTDAPVTAVDFKKVVTPVVNGSVVWDYRVESVVGLKAEFAHGFLSVICRDIPVKFTADEAGNVVGSLLRGMRRCDYLLQKSGTMFRY
ncbi:uncharacterized protein LOC108845564 [Raphanus sativus]|uniref:Uncharacterized protein LOC108845564 n=1 Tax=Raphanus sativus TaxID=3726 RepID=A0A9W3DFE0_RAPSA|nr:uncharacterized protein LOC108845564 [Raphanus sativus]